jgi:two-component system OmpR family sensor kinase
MSLQTRLMSAVIGFVSLILVIVAVITSATLGRTLEQQLDDRVYGYAVSLTNIVKQVPPNLATAENVMSGRNPGEPGLIVAVSNPVTGISGVVASKTAGELSGETESLTDAQLTQIAEALSEGHVANVSIRDLGSYRVTASTTSSGVVVVAGLPRDAIQGQLATLLTVIALATIGGLILLALTTAITIRVSLRPLRAVAATATRVANQPLDRGEVEITERVPASEADPRTETGLVGASLNKLLDHVNTSLASRQRNEERMRRFVADASHELRTPLASIRGYSELSLRALGQSTGAETIEGTTTSLERIQAQSLRMTRLVEDLLLLARLDEGRELVHGSVDLTQLALESLADARPTAVDHHWIIEVPEEPVIIVGDAGRLHQVVGNLLANARTHTPAGTTVTLTVSREADEAVLRIHDDGPGIDPAVRDELFSRFVRGDSSRARQTGGTGLGLAIATAIVEGHGGVLEVHSEPGDTTFTVRLPVERPEPTTATEGEAEAPED